MKFRYKKYDRETFRPVIPVSIKYKNKSLLYEVLVDSEADYCIFDAQIGELLGLKIRQGKKNWIFGITGKGEYYFTHKVALNVGGWDYETEVGFLPNIAQMGYGVVGQIGFFDTFVVKFDLPVGDIEVNPKYIKN